MLVLQRWCRERFGTDAVAVTSCEMLQDFYTWFVSQMEDKASGADVIRWSFAHIFAMTYYHGYVSRSEWNAGHFMPRDFDHLFTIRKLA